MKSFTSKILHPFPLVWLNHDSIDIDKIVNWWTVYITELILSLPCVSRYRRFLVIAYNQCVSGYMRRKLQQFREILQVWIQICLIINPYFSKKNSICLEKEPGDGMATLRPCGVTMRLGIPPLSEGMGSNPYVMGAKWRPTHAGRYYQCLSHAKFHKW